MIERLILSEAAYFYHREKYLSTSFINEIFKKVSHRKIGNYVAKIVNESFPLSKSGVVVEYSLCVFKIKDKPGFLNSDGAEEEIKYAYLLLVQHNDMLVISKKNISGLEKLIEKRISDVDYLTISRLFLSDKAYFEKFSMANMDISDNAIRNRNVEANDLRSSFSAAYLGRYVLKNIRIKESDNRISLALNTSRINKLGKKVTFHEYVCWLQEIIDKIKNFVLADSFLDNFSTPLKAGEILPSLNPSSILFHF
ncbi:hypothetical protein M3231_17620 [Neobacillus mesonae]|nr:hypothetical protein [Neobacillus mesonae]